MRNMIAYPMHNVKHYVSCGIFIVAVVAFLLWQLWHFHCGSYEMTGGWLEMFLDDHAPGISLGTGPGQIKRPLAEGHGESFTNDNCHNCSQFCKYQLKHSRGQPFRRVSGHRWRRVAPKAKGCGRQGPLSNPQKLHFPPRIHPQKLHFRHKHTRKNCILQF